jgi:hypothetical protein
MMVCFKRNDAPAIASPLADCLLKLSEEIRSELRSLLADRDGNLD